MFTGAIMRPAARREATMITDQLTEHDLTITFDGTGRMWKFRRTRPAAGAPGVDARLTPKAIVLSVTAPGLQCGDADLSASGAVLHVRGRNAQAILSADIALPRHVDLDVLETAYDGDVLEITVPLIAPRTAASSVESIAVAC
jgi:HSP20 family molecular chaperone IbpA